MFFGEFQHTIDQKNRIVIPAKFRVFVSEKEDRKGFIIGLSVIRNEPCLYMYPYSGMRKVIEDVQRVIGSAPDGDDLLRLFSTNAEFVAIDSQSRIVIPQKLIDAVRLPKEVILTGVIDRIEIWSAGDWLERQKGHGGLKERLIHLSRGEGTEGSSGRSN
ncbi:MAG: division/cell wall cluster transcriptional repressor MraZ [Planctomycetes bacterium RBG_16_59_8]|nr:MAG: division/cell wall cluster transcriptional repressor MraZ [Planctomycetes bacterium RBG_16_59_8]